MFDLIKKLFFGAGKEEKKPLNLYQYKFLRYKEERDKKYPLDIRKVHVPCVKDMVSVILPVYNGDDVLASSIESVLRQTYKNFEFIIINDGSKDKTLEIAREYEKKDSRIRVLDQENRKIPRTLSRGFDEAKGEFLTWTSADNVMDVDFLEKMVNDMKKNEESGMVWANMRLIDAKGKKLRNHGWFEYPMGSSNVIFPMNAYELNTYANNTIGAAFMYRKTAKDILGCYSSFKHTLEDYDYWMRMNSLLKLTHTDFTEPIYSYRWHDKSLTAKDNELGITKNRYKLMVLDDFRRDFYLSPLLWYVKSDSENKEIAEEFKKIIKNAGHEVLDKSDFDDLFFGKANSDVVYISFGKNSDDIFLPRDAYKVSVNCMDEGFSFYASTVGKSDNSVFFEDALTMFSFLDAKIKNDILYGIEERIETSNDYTKKLSVILCTHKYSEVLEKSLEALCNQSAEKTDYEIIFVSNDYKNGELKELCQNMSKKYQNIDISYITAPIKGLSYARNKGLMASESEYLLYIDDDAVADAELVKETIRGFEENEKAGVIGGQVILEVPEYKKGIVTGNTVGLWSNLEIDGDDIRFAENYGEFPYGANFAVRTASLMRIGGFRTSYGRVGNNFGGGEETLVSFMMGEIGMKVALNPRSKVKHMVDESRFTEEHIDKTVYAGIMTQYQLRRDLYAPLDWNDINIRERAMSAKKKAEKAEGADKVFYEATARAFRDVLLSRQKDYEYLNKF